MVLCLLDRDLIEKYEGVDPKIKGYQERLRKAFTKDTTLVQDLKAALEFEKQMWNPKSILKLLTNLQTRFWS